MRLRRIAALILLLATVAFITPARAVTYAFNGPREILVDPNGVIGKYKTIQAAIDFAATQSPTEINPWTVRLVAGAYVTSTGISLVGKQWITIAGLGPTASSIVASNAWFVAVAAGTQPDRLIDLTNSVGCKLELLTVDALTNQDATSAADPDSGFMSALLTTGANKLVINTATIKAFVYGVWSSANGSGGLIDIFNSKIISRHTAVRTFPSEIWHIFGSDLRGHRMDSSLTQLSSPTGLVITGGDTTVWGSHIHGEDMVDPSIGVQGISYAPLFQSATRLVVVGTTVHAKIMGDMDTSTRTSSPVQVTTGNSGNLVLVGDDLLLDTGTLTQGSAGALVYGVTAGQGSLNITIAGSNFYDASGSGGTRRGSLVKVTTSGTSPVFRISGSRLAGGFVGSNASAINTTQWGRASGTSTLVAGTSIVLLITDGGNKGGAAATSFTNGSTSVTGTGTTFLTDFKPGQFIRAASHTDATWTRIASIASDTAMTLDTGGYRGATLATTQAKVGIPNDNTQPEGTYQVALTPTTAPGAAESYYVTTKHASGFTITSTNGASTVTLDWVLSR